MQLKEFGIKMEEIGKMLVKGYCIENYTLGEKNMVLTPKQQKFISSQKDMCLTYGGFGSGKTISLDIKMILMCLCFPHNTVLLGRKHLSDLESSVLPDLMDLMDKKWFHHRVKDGVINFFNGSKIVMFGLDSLQDGSLADIKKAQQKLKGLNLGAWFIDQLEEVDEAVVTTLNTRLRKMESPWRQGNATTNPANYWAYSKFNENGGIDEANKEAGLYEDDLLLLIRSTVYDIQDYVPKDYIPRLLRQHGGSENYRKKFVQGIWTPDIFGERAVFGQEYINKFKVRDFKTEEGCEIYEDYREGMRYQMGVDPSEGVVDPSSISVVSENGEKVAKFNGKIPISALGEKVKYLYYKYGKPLIIPESNASGQALLLQIRDLNVFTRVVYDEQFDKDTEKLGWKTSYQSKQSLISNFQELLRVGFPKIYDQKTINEFKTFEWTDSAKQKGAGAQRNFHDDDVMSTMLAYWELNPAVIEKRNRRLVSEMGHKKIKRFQYN